MVEKIYWIDSYKKDLDAKVTAVSPNGIELDSTIFYPTGGGQPCDTGKITVGNTDYKVTEVKKIEESIMHFLDPNPNFDKNADAHCKIDWERRYAHMRYHTATHVVGGLAIAKYGAMFTGGQIYADRSRFDFDMQSLDRKLATEIVEESQHIIDKNLDVVSKMLTKEEATAIPNLARTLPGNELMNKLSSFRVVEIVGFDMQLDGGTHVSNTKEIGKLELLNFENKGSKRKRIEIVIK
jgi:misacylated tRNA(Ala) deacylase